MNTRLAFAAMVAVLVGGTWAAGSVLAGETSQGGAGETSQGGDSRAQAGAEDRKGPTLAPGPNGTVVELAPGETTIDVDDPRHPENHIGPDTPIGFENPATGGSILCDDGEPLTQTDREFQAALEDAVARGNPDDVAPPTCDDGSVPDEYREMAAREALYAGP